jgi:hypothetical protein
LKSLDSLAQFKPADVLPAINVTLRNKSKRPKDMTPAYFN